MSAVGTVLRSLGSALDAAPAAACCMSAARFVRLAQGLSRIDKALPRGEAAQQLARGFAAAAHKPGHAAAAPATAEAAQRRLIPGIVSLSTSTPRQLASGVPAGLAAAASLASAAQQRALHSSAAAGVAQTVSEDEAGDEEFLQGDEQLRDMMEPQYLETGSGARLAYHRVPPTGSHLTGVIFCGGLASNMNGLKATMLEMHARRNAHPFVRFDYRGHGLSSGNFLDTTLGDWYEDTLAIIDRVALPGPHILVGSSIGGWIALKAAAARRERVKGVVLVAPAVDITDLWWDGLTAGEQQDARDTGFVPLGGGYKVGGRVRTSFFEEASDHCLLDTAARDAQVRCPVRILQGAQDSVVPPFVATEVAHWLESKDVHLTLVKDGDHRLSRPEDLRSLMIAVEELLAIDAQRVSSR